MSEKVSDILAQTIAAEGVDIVFTLMGDANMYWSASIADNENARLIHARHEHCCVAMADAYARATGKVGVASVTCGPGYTQIMTALVMAARGNARVVVFAGDAPIGASWYLQSIDRHRWRWRLGPILWRSARSTGRSIASARPSTSPAQNGSRSC